MTAKRERPMTAQEVAEETGIPVGTLAYWRHDGRGPAYLKIGKRVKYDPAVVWAWIDAHQRDPEAAA